MDNPVVLSTCGSQDRRGADQAALLLEELDELDELEEVLPPDGFEDDDESELLLAVSELFDVSAGFDDDSLDDESEEGVDEASDDLPRESVR